MTRTLTFDTGIVEYDVNGTTTIRFNPADDMFVSRLYETFGKLEELQDKLSASEDNDVLAAFGEADKDMRAQIDALLGEGTADAVFPHMSCYALSGGLPVWVHFCLALLEETGNAYGKEFGKQDATTARYRKRFDEISKKYRKRT